MYLKVNKSDLRFQKCISELKKIIDPVLNNNLLMKKKPLTDNDHDWLHAVDDYAHIYGWDDKVTSHLALSKLREPTGLVPTGP
jgi:hypothetical protein